MDMVSELETCERLHKMTIQQQTLKLELGEVYEEFFRRTESYVKGLVGKPWWYSTKQLLQNEGPLYRMVEHCLIYVVELEDRIAGYKAYTNYLTSEYGSGQLHNNQRADMMATGSVHQTVSSPLLGGNAYSERDVRRLREWLPAEDEDFMYVIQGTKEGRGTNGTGIQEAANMLDMTVDEVWTKYRLIKRRAARREVSA